MKLMGDRVRELREWRGETREVTARLAGIPKTTLQTLEDKPQARSGYLLELADHFGVEPRWLQDGKGPKWAVTHSGTRDEKISPFPPRPLRLDPHMLRDGFVMVSAVFEREKAAFDPDRDCDLLARAYEWARTGSAEALHEIDRDVVGRVLERGVLGGEAKQGEVGGKATKASKRVRRVQGRPR